MYGPDVVLMGYEGLTAKGYFAVCCGNDGADYFFSAPGVHSLYDNH
jgi:hypothetical protein